MVFKRLFADLAEDLFLKTPGQVQRKGKVLVDGFQNHRKYQNLEYNPSVESGEQVSPVSPKNESPESE